MLIVFLYLLFVTSVYGCPRDNTNYPNGTIWVDEDNKFSYRCEMDTYTWTWAVESCLFGGKAEVPLNSSKIVEEVEYHCWQSNGEVSSRFNSAKHAKCGGIHAYGSSWIIKSFTYRCDAYGQQVLVGCTTNNGEFIKANTTEVIGSVKFVCYHYNNGSVIFRPYDMPNPDRCFAADANIYVEPNDMHRTAHYLTRCVSGQLRILGCQLKQKGSPYISLGNIEEIDGYRHSCLIESDGEVHYRIVKIRKMLWLAYFINF